MIRVGVIGVGSMGRNHTRVYSDTENVTLVAVADPDQNTAEKVGTKHNVSWYTDYKEMLNCKQLDAVSIAVPTKLHKEITLYALRKGIHVLVEKPIASTEAEAREMIACARDNNVKLMVGHIERFNTALQELKKRLDAGELGQIYKIDAQRVGPFPSRVMDVGVIIDLSVHDIDIINFLTQQQPSRVYATAQQKLHPHHEDSVVALLYYPQDVVATLNINYLSPSKIRQLKVFGEKGMFLVNYLQQELYFYENPGFMSDSWNSVVEGDIHKIKIPKKEPLAAELEEFIHCIRNNYDVPVKGERGLEVLQIAQKVLQSASEKRIIEL